MVRKLWGALLALSSLIGAVTVIDMSTAAAGDHRPPAVLNVRPNGTYLQGQPIVVQYTCDDLDGDLVSCVGDYPVGATPDTSLGEHSHSVTATDAAGHVTTVTRTYRIVPMRARCSATVLRVGEDAYGATNPAEVPCTGGDTETQVTPPISLPIASLGDVEIGEAWSRVSGGGGVASSLAAVPTIDINILNTIELKIEGAAASAYATPQGVGCGPVYHLTSSQIGYLELGIWKTGLEREEVSYRLSEPRTIPIPLFGAIHLNQQVVEGGTITRRAVFIDLPGTANDVVIGEAKAGFDCLA